jgi:hypothetical protein
MAERGTPDLISSQAPFIHALVQKSVTAITNFAGRLTHWMLSESCAASQGAEGKKLAPRLRIGRDYCVSSMSHLSFRGLLSPRNLLFR